MSRILHWLDDRMNPIVIKELRQGVRSRFLIGVLYFLLAAQLMVLGSHVVTRLQNINSAASRAGSGYFFSIFMVLLGVGLIIMPLYLGLRVSLEKQNENTDLLFITALTPRSIVFGKLASGLLLVIWLYSATSPFLLVSFFLRGISLPVIVVLLYTAFLAILVSLQMGILLGLLPFPKLLKSLLGLGFVSFQMFVYGFTVSNSQSFARYGYFRIFGTSSFTADLFGPLLLMTLISLLLFVCLFLLSEALLKPPSANKMFSIRASFTVLWLFSGGICLWLSKVQSSFAPLYFWTVVVLVFLVLCLIIGFSERESLSRRIRHTIPSSKVARGVLFPLFSGVASAFTWVVLVAGVSVLFLVSVHGSFFTWRHSKDFSDVVYWGFCGTLLYAYVYCISSYFLKKLLFPRLTNHFTWLFVVVVFFLSMLVPLVYVSVFGGFYKNTMFLINPFGFLQTSQRGTTSLMGILWAVATLPGLFYLYRNSLRQFVPLQKEAGSGAQRSSSEHDDSGVEEETVESPGEHIPDASGAEEVPEAPSPDGEGEDHDDAH